jgi:protein O-mannosyl-transferase
MEKNLNPDNHYIHPWLGFRNWFKNNYRNLIIIAILILVSYGNSISNDFMSDDNPSLVEDKGISSISFVFSKPDQYLRYFVYWGVNHFFGLNPAAFRLIDIIFHISFTYLGYAILTQLTTKRIAFLTSLLFGIHPLTSEAVDWISAGVYIQYGSVFLASLLFYILSKSQNKYYWISICLFLCTSLTSEKGFVLFPILFVFELAYGNLRKNWKKLIPYALICLGIVIYIFILSKAASNRVSALQSDYYLTAGFYNPLLQIPVALSSYIKLIFWPFDLSFYHSDFIMTPSVFIIRVILCLFLLILGIYGYKKNRYLFFWLSFFFISLLPFLTPFRIAWVVAERYIYIGTFGILAIFIQICDPLFSKKHFQLFFRPFIILLVLTLATRTIIRNNDWKNADNLYIATVKTAPSDPKSHVNMGDVYRRHGQYEDALIEFKYAIKLQSNYADAYHNAGNTLVLLEQYDEALKYYHSALKYNPNLWQSYLALGVIYFQKKDFNQAISNFEIAIKINPQQSSLYYNLALSYRQIGENEKAIDAFRKALKIDPNNKIIQSEFAKTP